MLRRGVRAREDGSSTVKDDFGSRTKRRRTAKVTAILAAAPTVAMSKSKARKVVKAQEKSFKNPRWPFERKCGRLYEDLLRAVKQNKSERLEKAQNILDTFFSADDESPILQTQNLWKKSREDVELRNAYVQELSRQSVSRSLQMCFKIGDENIRAQILKHVEPVFPELASTAAGSHLCLKILRYNNNSSTMSTRLFENYKSFWSKYGSRVWDFLASQQSMNKIVTRLFYSRLFQAELEESVYLSQSADAILEAYDKCSEMLKKTIRARLLELVDKLVHKELLGGEIAQRFLRTVVQILDREGDDDQNSIVFSEAIFEATRALLKSKDGVYCVCYAMGYWSARQRRDFIDESDRVLALEQMSWLTYLENSVDAVFVGRMLMTVDDTKRTTTQILAPIMGLKVGKKGDAGWSLELVEDAEKNWRDILFEPSQAHQMLGVIGAALDPSGDNNAKFVTSFKLDQLRFKSVTSKKDNSVRAEELMSFWRSGLTILRQNLPSFDEWLNSSNILPLLKAKLFETS